jgi:hypothetical protein
MTSSASILLVPGEDASWRVWKPRASSPSEEVDTLADYSDRSKPVLVGLPATACRTLGLMLPQADHSVLEDMVSAQLERRGLKTAGGGVPPFRFHVLGHAGPNAVVSVDVLAEPFPEELAVHNAENYAAALRLVQLPVGQLVITEEQGELVIAANHQGKLFHSHVFAQRPAEAGQLAQEILFTRLGLESLPGSTPTNGITLVGQWDADVVADLRQVAALPVQVVDRLAPGNIDTRNWALLLPRSVSDARAAAKSRRRLIAIGMLAAVVASVAIVAGIFYLKQREAIADELAAQVEKTAAPAAEVKLTAARWKAMAADLDPRTYPMVVLQQISELLPPSGINMREYEARMEEIKIRLDARDATTSGQFFEEIKKHKNLSRYTWTMPQPKVRDNKTVSCNIQGKLTTP